MSFTLLDLSGSAIAENSAYTITTLTGIAYAESEASSISLTPGVGTLTITGYAPTTVQAGGNLAIAPGVGTLTITGYAPTTVQAGGNLAIAPGVGTLTITGYAPTTVQAAPNKSVTTDILVNNTNTVLASTGVSYSWYSGGRIGSLAGLVPFEGTGTTNSTGHLVATGLPAGAGVIFVAQLGAGPSTDGVYYQALTAA